jgi:hypothetical protein
MTVYGKGILITQHVRKFIPSVPLAEWEDKQEEEKKRCTKLKWNTLGQQHYTLQVQTIANQLL